MAPPIVRALVTILSIAFVLALLGCNAPNPNVLTQHNDKFRTGAYLAETTLTPDRVRHQGMHILYWVAPEGVDAKEFDPAPAYQISGGILTQLLYVRQVAFLGGARNGLFVATKENRVYALDADSGDEKWATNLTDLDSRPCRRANGIEATPVIDLGRRKIFVVFSTEYGGEGCGVFSGSDVAFFLAALDITNGSYMSNGSPTVTRLVPPDAIHDGNPRLPFNPQLHRVHPGLLLDRNSVFVAFGSYATLEGKGEGFRGWIMRLNEDNLAVQNVFCTSPGEVGAGVWQGGGGLAADPAGNVYFLTGNGVADFERHFNGSRFVTNNLFGDSFVKLAMSGGRLVPSAWAPEDAIQLNEKDADLGSGGVVLIPDTNRIIGGGKAGVMYVLDRDSMSRIQQFNSSTNLYHPWLRAQSWDGGPHLHGAPTYWRGPDPTYGYVYVWGEKDILRMYRFDVFTGKFEEQLVSSGGPAGHLATHREVLPYRPGSIRALPDTMPGGMLSLSANGNKSHTGIVWAILPVARCMPLLLKPCVRKEDGDMDIFGPFPAAVYAFDAESLDLLWNADLRDWEAVKPNGLSQTAHWAPPTIADGKVFVPSESGMIVVYELCKEHACAGTSKPIQPEAPGCEDCHRFGNVRQVLETFVKPLSVRFPNEAAVNGWPRNALRSIATPLGKKKDMVFTGEGVKVYEAGETPGEKAGLSWQLRDSIADLQEVRFHQPRGEATPPIRIHIFAGGAWTASDGSKAVAQVERTAPSPVQAGNDKDAPWTLFRIVGSSRAGILSEQGYAQSVYTSGGAPPARTPTRRGEIARVPYRSQYWLYR
jgi:hypothetical protein